MPNYTPDDIATSSVNDIAKQNPTILLQQTQTTEESQIDFAQLASKSRFAHVIATFRGGSSFDSFIAKLKGRDKRNINATLLIDDLKINTYANSDWSGAPGVIIRPQIKKLVIFPVDIGSGGYFAKPDLAKNYNPDDPSSNHSISAWVKTVGYNYQYSYRSVRPKYSLADGIEKMAEISKRRTRIIEDYDDVDYYTIDKKLIKTSAPGRYTNPEASTDGVDHIPIGEDELKHNESHINCSLADVENVFITKEDLEDSATRISKTKLYNSREVLLYTAIKGIKLLNDQRVKAINNQADLDYMIDFEISKIVYLFNSKEFFLEKIVEFTKNLQVLDELDYSPDQDCSDLEIAFASKKEKFPEFDEQSKENKKIWLDNNIRKLQKAILNNQSETAYYQELYQFQNQEFNNQETKTIIKDKLITQLQQEVKLVIYDKRKAKLEDFLQSQNEQSLETTITKLEEQLLKPDNKDHGFLVALLSNDFSVPEIKRFFFENPNFSDEFKKENLDYKNQDCYAPLHIAAQNGHKEVVEVLLEGGAEVNKPDPYGKTPLYFAAQNGHKEVVEFLLERGAEVNKAERYGKTPLHIAAYNGHKEVVEFLLERGAEVNEGFCTTLYFAAYSGHKEVVEVLLEKGADINDDILHIAAQNGHKEVVEVLLERGAEVNKADNDGFTPLCFAAQNGHKELVEVLLERGAEVNKANNNGFTPLYFAAQNGHKEVVKVLLERGAEVNKPDPYGKTPLYFAAQNGHKELVKVLLEGGAEVNKANNNGFTPLYFAAQNGHKELVKVLLERGAEVNKADNNGFTPLYIAAQNGHKEVVKVLLERGAEVNKPDPYGKTPLYFAAQNGHKELVKVLLEGGAEVNKANNNGFTPLNIAAYNGHKEVVEVLLELGAEVNKADYYGNTPLDVAAYNRHEEVVEFLLEQKSGAKQVGSNNSELLAFHCLLPESQSNAISNYLSFYQDQDEGFKKDLEWFIKINLDRKLKSGSGFFGASSTLIINEQGKILIKGRTSITELPNFSQIPQVFNLFKKVITSQAIIDGIIKFNYVKKMDLIKMFSKAVNEEIIKPNRTKSNQVSPEVKAKTVEKLTEKLTRKTQEVMGR